MQGEEIPLSLFYRPAAAKAVERDGESNIFPLFHKLSVIGRRKRTRFSADFSGKNGRNPALFPLCPENSPGKSLLGDFPGHTDDK